MNEVVAVRGETMCELCHKSVYSGGLCRNHYAIRQRIGTEAFAERLTLQRQADSVEIIYYHKDVWEKEVMRRNVLRAVSQLTDRQRKIITARYLSEAPMTLEEVGNLFRVTRERVRQIEAKAVQKLRRVSSGLQDYRVS